MAVDSQHGPPNNSEVFDYVNHSIRDEETFHFLGFEFLHRLNIVQIQNQLIAAKEDIVSNKGTKFNQQRLKELLDDYTKAIQNYNYIHSATRLDHYTTERRKQRLKRVFSSITTTYHHTRPFESHYYYLHDSATRPTPDILRNKLRLWLPSRLSYSSEERRHRSKEYEEGQPPNEISPFVDNVVRLCIALLAVVILIVPMCIMSVWPSLSKNLVVAAVFMVLFACGMSFGVKGTNVETLVATATYSAVLAVFVGTNMQSM